MIRLFNILKSILNEVKQLPIGNSIIFAVAQTGEKIISPPELWKGYDPNKGDFKTAASCRSSSARCITSPSAKRS